MPTTMTWSKGLLASIRSVASRASAGPIPMIPAETAQSPVVPVWENAVSSLIRLRPPARTTALSSGRIGASMATRLVVPAEDVTSPSWWTNR